MSRHLDRLRDCVVVITGASSGIGRETAVEFAKHKSRLVLGARREEELDETARLCREAGGEAKVVVTDVTIEQDVQALADAAVSLWGRIDVWINNAGVTMFAPLTAGKFEDHRRVIETNLFGAMFGVRAAVPIFRKQKRGVLINVGSIVSKIAQPFVGAYSVSKFALLGVTETLRAELADEPGIEACTILPYAVDTPHFQSGANEIGLRARAMPPVQPPERVARAIVDLAANPRPEVHVPRSAPFGIALHRLFPRTTERLLLRALRRWHFDDVEQANTTGNLYDPVEAQHGEVHGNRRPHIGAPRFVAWALLELGHMQWQTVTGWFRRGPQPERLVTAH